MENFSPIAIFFYEIFSMPNALFSFNSPSNNFSVCFVNLVCIIAENGMVTFERRKKKCAHFCYSRLNTQKQPITLIEVFITCSTLKLFFLFTGRNEGEIIQMLKTHRDDFCAVLLNKESRFKAASTSENNSLIIQTESVLEGAETSSCFSTWS